MKKNILLFFKGIILGFGFILPGVSGGVLAISMGIYEKIIKAISHFFSDFKENVKFLLVLGLGMIVSVMLCAVVLDYAFEYYPIPTTLLFLGLIIGGFPILFKKINVKFRASNLITLLIGAVILFLLTLVSDGTNVVLDALNLSEGIKLLFVGFLSAATIVVPGISGSFVLMVMGYYYPLLSIVSDLIKFNNFISNALIILPFGIGLIVGVLVIVKIIEYLLEKYEIKTYYLITGFVVSSVIKVFLSIFDYTMSAQNIILGVTLFIFGTIISLKYFQN